MDGCGRYEVGVSDGWVWWVWSWCEWVVVVGTELV